MVRTAVIVGTALEHYDYFLYGTAAALVFNVQFFVTDNPLVGTLAAFATFAAGFAARPFGAIIFGHLGDTVGRRNTLIMTLLLIGISTGLIGLIPNYDTIGVWAPIMLVTLRILQGISFGGEWAGAVTLAAEHAPKGKEGAYACLPMLGSPVGNIVSTGAFLLLGFLPPEVFDSWGWRIPFLAAFPLLAVALWVRRQVDETPDFEAAAASDEIKKIPALEIFRNSPGQMFTGSAVAFVGIGGFFVVTTFAMTYGTETLGLDRSVMLTAVLSAAVLQIFTVIYTGRLADRIEPERIALWTCGVTAVLAFPVIMARSFREVMERDGRRAMQYSSTDGDPEMREAAARRSTEMGVRTSADQVIITTGSQQGIGLLGQTLINDGDVVLVENPTFVSAMLAFSLQGARFRPIEVDENGVIPELLEDGIRRWKPKAVYLIPTFQNPTGITLSVERRARIADIFARNDTWLIEDDPYSEIRFTEQRYLPISSDPRLDDRSFLLNTLSKVLSPGLRVGWVRGPCDVLPYLSRAKQAATLQSSTIDQLAAVHYLKHNDLQSKLDPVRAEYARRRDALYAGLQEVLPAGSDIRRPDGGLFIWARLPEGYDATAVLPRAIKAGCIYIPGAPFYVGRPDERSIRLSYSANTVELTTEGLARLAEVFKV